MDELTKYIQDLNDGLTDSQRLKYMLLSLDQQERTGPHRAQDILSLIKRRQQDSDSKD